MRLSRLAIAVSCACTLSVGADLYLKVEVDQCRPTRAWSCIVFDGEPVAVSVTATFVGLMAPGAPPTDAVFTFPRQSWVESMNLNVSKDDGVIVKPEVRIVRTRFAEGESHRRDRPTEGGFVLYDHESVTAELELTGLAPGDYLVEARFGKASSQPDYRGRFSIRRGDEDLETIRAWYRYRADQASGDFRAWESILRELMNRHEPDNDRILITIADGSVDRVPPEETARLYREARTTLAERLRRDLSRPGGVRAEERKRREREVEDLTLFERALPMYRERKDSLRFGVYLSAKGASYAWFDRSSGRLLETIDRTDPLRVPMSPRLR